MESVGPCSASRVEMVLQEDEQLFRGVARSTLGSSTGGVMFVRPRLVGLVLSSRGLILLRLLKKLLLSRLSVRIRLM